MGGGLLGVDPMETGADGEGGSASGSTAESRYTVHEVDSTCERTGLNEAVPGRDVPARIVDWLEERAVTAGGQAVVAGEWESWRHSTVYSSNRRAPYR